MTLAQALAAAAAALVVAIGPLGGALISSASAQVSMDRTFIRSAVAELADLMEQNYVFPDAAREYASHLRTRAASGAYDGFNEPAKLADALESELNEVHADAHLRVSVAEADANGAPMGRAPPGGAQAIGDPIWLAGGVGYLRINGFPGSDESVAQMTRALDALAEARTLILDVRRCPGGGLREMDVLFSRLYAAPTRVMIMDTRTAAARMNPLGEDPHLRPAAAPEGVTRSEHWALPTSPVSPLSNARVYLLTGRTGSACEHLSQALRETGRATLVGTPTGGAGHYGGMRTFGGGRFEIFLPVGNSYAPGAQSWEGVGVEPHRNVPMDDALTEVLREIGVPAEAAARVPAFAAPARRVEAAAPGRRAYGIGLFPPRGGEPYVTVEEVAPDMVAEQAGVRAGDRIIAINGVAVANMSPAQFRSAIRSSPMTLTLQRGEERLDFRMSLD